MSSTSGPLAIWLEQAITSLLTAPGPISIPTLPGGGGGPGPIDIFSTRFDNTFTDNVSAVINGKTFNKSGLKDQLVTVKQKFNPQTASFSSSVENDVNQNNGQVGLLFKWTGEGPNASTTVSDESAAEVSLNASVVNDGGAPRINTVTIVSELLATIS